MRYKQAVPVPSPLAEATSRLLNRPLAPRGVEAEPGMPSRATEWRSVTSVLAAADELATFSGADGLLKRAVELARDRIGLERVGFYMRDPSAERLIMRGTWGTGLDGQTTDEHGLHHECSRLDYERLRQIQNQGALWLYHHHVPYVMEEGQRSILIGHGWLAVTPLLYGREVLGIMYNDVALSHAPMDEDKQARAALFCSMVARLYATRRDTPAWPPLPRGPEQSSLVQWVLRSLEADPSASGDQLARQAGISPGYLARSFKTQTGVSLVEHRNRLRIARFLEAVEGGGKNLLRAALDSGFGSYAQFHRVYRKLFGATPREHLPRRESREL
jgi:AraC-like DNA-binding protein